MNRKNSLVILASLFPLLVFSQTWNETKIIESHQDLANHKFGINVALYGTHGIVNAEDYAYFIKYDGSEWLINQTVNAMSSLYPYRSEPVSIFENYAAIALNDDYGSGKVQVFKLEETSDNWLLEDVFETEVTYDAFGTAVSISQNILAIGAYTKSTDQYREGVVYIYELIDGQWVFQQIIQADDLTYAAGFGWSVAVQDSDIFVGSVYNEDGFGAVYQFSKNQEMNEWQQVSKIVSPYRSDEGFGSAVEISDDYLLIDSREDTTYLFKYVEVEWIIAQKFSGERSSSRDIKSIDIDKDRLLLGKPGLGVIEVYEKNGSDNWIETFKMYASDGEDYDDFGIDVSFYGSHALVGASKKDVYSDITNGLSCMGGVYFYESTDIPYAFEESQWFTDDIEGRLPQFLDYDDDGDLDLFVSVFEENNETVYESRIYANTGSSFESTSHTFPYIDTDGFAKWTHMNYDDLPDLLIYSQYGNPNFRLFVNKGESFEEKEISFPTFDDYQPYGFHFADYDNDGDEDILIQGYNEYPFEMRILVNNGNFEYEDSGLTFDGYFKSQNPWGDFNSDGWIDFMSFEDNGCDNTREMVIYRNMGDGTFHKMTSYIIWAPNDDLLNRSGTAEWFDYNGDGKLDIILAGQYTCSTGDGYSMVMINEDNDIFNPHSPYGYSMFGDYTNSVDIEHADFNNDGTPDVFMYGEKDGLNTTNLWLNDESEFAYFEIKDMLHSSWVGSIDVADFDNDGDVDLVIAGEETYSTQKVKLYRNNAVQGWAEENEPPSIPSNLLTNVNGKDVTLSWNESTDDITPTSALKYNVSLSRNDSIIIHANYLVDINCLVSNTFLALNDLADGDYAWTVQAVDDSHSSSTFANQEEFTIGNEPALGLSDKTIFQVYPNPTSNFITINISRSEETHFNLIDINGREVLSNNFSHPNFVLNLSDVPQGLYFLNIQNSRGSVTKKIIRE